jgi:hypothetical protein
MRDTNDGFSRVLSALILAFGLIAALHWQPIELAVQDGGGGIVAPQVLPAQPATSAPRADPTGAAIPPGAGDGAGAGGMSFGPTGNATGFDNVTMANGTVAHWLTLTANTTIAVTDGATITPAGSYQPLSSAGTVTATIATTGMAAGDQLTLVNTANTTINVLDAGTAKLSAAAALGQFDSLRLVFDGTNWVEVGRSNN